MVLIINNTGCIDSDWEYEFYYYIDVYYNGNGTFTLQLPIPIDEEIIRGLSLREGSCIYSINQTTYGTFLSINGNSSLSLHSNYETYDNCLYYELRQDSPYNVYCNKQLNISVVVESRMLGKRTEIEDWELYYSSIFNGITYIEMNGNTWKQHLPPEYSVALDNPQEFSIALGNGWVYHEISEGKITLK